MTTALDLAPDNFAVIIDASTLAKLGRMGTDEFGFLNLFLRLPSIKNIPGY